MPNNKLTRGDSAEDRSKTTKFIAVGCSNSFGVFALE
jgi:hypothetical protein